MKGLAIYNGYLLLPPIAHFLDRMDEEFAALGIVLERKPTTEVLAHLSENGRVMASISDYDFVLFCDKDKYIASMLEDSGLRLFNRAKAIEDCDDKFLTYLRLQKEGIRIPKTISAPLCYAKEGNRDFLKNLRRELSFPFICKANYGSMGKEVHLVRDKEELNALEERYLHQPHLYQEYISSSRGKDYRIIVLGGNAVAIMEREAKEGDFRSNIALGGTGIPVSNCPKAFIQVAEKAAKALNLDYGGVDLLIGEGGEPILCEVNSNAFFEGIEKATGLNIARMYAEYIKKHA